MRRHLHLYSIKKVMNALLHFFQFDASAIGKPELLKEASFYKIMTHSLMNNFLTPLSHWCTIGMTKILKPEDQNSAKN